MHGLWTHNRGMIRSIALLLSTSLLLSACTGLGLVTGAAAVTGISAAKEGGVRGAVSDTAIKIKINDLWFKYDVDAFTKLQTTIDQGRVLILGVVQNPEHRVEAVRLAWQVKGVKQVMNEIRVEQSEGVKGFVRDAWITSKLRTSLTIDRDVQSINYSIDTVQGIVYLMGVAVNQKELNHVIEKVRTTSGVKKVVSYVKMAGEEIEPTPTPQPPTQSDPVQNYAPDYIPEQNDPTPSQPSIKDQYYNS